EGETVAEILEQVRSHEPMPPARLRPKLPRDLETVCLKCLQKEPACRYSSAQALAEDLDRFRRGEPILARRQGMVHKLWRTVRRNPTAAAALVAVALAIAVTGYVSPAIYHNRQVIALVQQIDDGLRADDWSAAHVQQLESWIDALRQLSPQEAELTER